MKASDILDKDFKKQLVIRSQQLKPVVMLGNHGLTANVLKEIDAALEAHELIKIRISATNREERQALIYDILSHSHAQLVQTVGHVISIYRQKIDKTK